MLYWKCYCRNLFYFFIYVFGFFYLSYANLSFANEISNVTPKIKLCVTCHTLSGNSVVAMWPKLAEQHSDYMMKQLLEYKKGKAGDRFDPTMFGMLQGITENELRELADHFSKQVLEKGKVKIDKDQFILGKEIYLYGSSDGKVSGCVGCHGLDGTGNGLANFPSLKWQHKEYLITQLKKFKLCDRSNDVNGIMRDIVSNMSDEQMNAVVMYISFMD